MTQQGQVLRIQGQKVWILVGSTSQSVGEAKASCCSDTEATIEARNSSGLAVNPGDTVTVASRTGAAVAPLAISAAFPLAFFFAGYIGSPTWFGVSGDPLRILFGIAGLALGLVVPFAMSRIRKSTQYPEIVA